MPEASGPGNGLRVPRPSPDSRLSPQLIHQAAHWSARLSADPADHATLQAWHHWHQAADEHRSAWHYIEQLSLYNNCRLEQRVTAPVSAASCTRRRTQRPIRYLLLLSALGGILFGLWQAGSLPRTLAIWQADHKGSRLSNTRLQDGSHIQLGPQAAVNVDYRHDQRRLQLLQGSVEIQSSQDPRPLILDFPQGRLRARHPKLAIRVHTDHIEVVVHQGEVTLEFGRQRIALKSGERLDIPAILPIPAVPRTLELTSGPSALPTSEPPNNLRPRPQG